MPGTQTLQFLAICLRVIADNSECHFCAAFKFIEIDKKMLRINNRVNNFHNDNRGNIIYCSNT